MRRPLLLLVLAALLLVSAATAGAHPTGGDEDAAAGSAAPVHLMHLGAGSAFTRLGETATATPALGRGLGQETPSGPCTDAAKDGMPDGEGHDHQDVEQHRGLRCRIEQAAFLPLTEELAARPDVVLGEMDVKADIAAVSVIFPEGGILFFDVSDPAAPEFLSWYRSSQCEGAALANNCGAFVDLSADGRTAFIAQQAVSFVPSADPDSTDPGPTPTTSPGIEVVDASDPRNPVRQQVFPVLSQGGVHTARSHVIPEGPGADRAPGQYVFGIANRLVADAGNVGSGIDISRFDPDGGPAALTPLSRIEIGETHDTFIQNDPLDGRTYLYIAGGFSKGLLVYDVTNPEAPKRVAAWDLTPECRNDWYSHTVDVTHRNGRRYVTMPAELFTSGAQRAADQAKGCGAVVGNGDQPGPLWIFDATDFGALGQEGDTAAQLKAKSEDALVASWTNPARRAGGSLTFSPHNQQIVGDKIYLSDYHGGVYVLDASGAFAGRSERPRELGYIVPSGESSNAAARPLVPPGSPAPTAVPRTRGRSSIWDMVFYKGHILAADQVGGFYSLRETGPDAGAGGGDGSSPAAGSGTGSGSPGVTATCRDLVAPTSRVLPRRGGLTRRGLDLRGRSRDAGCAAALRRVRVSVARETSRSRCRFLKANGRFSAPRSCLRSSYLSARGTRTWRLRLKARLPRGTYKVWARGIDAAGNLERKNLGNYTRVRVR
jgi:hypothetical protein